MKKNLIPIAIVLFSAALLIVAFSANEPKPQFALQAEQVLTDLGEFEHVTNSQVPGMIEDTNAYTFVDLRSPYDFDVKHIEGAVNIPTAFLLDEENLNALDDFQRAGQTVVLYGQTERESIGPWTLLYSLGYENTKILMGGFACLEELDANCPTTMAQYDYAKIASQGGIKEVEVIKKKPVPKKKKTIPVQKKVKVEEEGGC